MLPALFIALTIEISIVIKIVILTIIVQQVEGDLITPRIMGNKLSIHPLSVILVILICVHLFGVLGAFVGIPLYRIILAVLNSYKKIKINNIITDKQKEDISIEIDDKK